MSPVDAYYDRDTNHVGSQKGAVWVDLAADFAYFKRLPVAVQQYLVEESPVDFSAFDVYRELPNSSPGQLIERLRMAAVEQLNEETTEQRREDARRGRAPVQWPYATLWNTRPIRRLRPKSQFRRQ